MLTLKNPENQTYNPNIDTYMVLETTNYLSTPLEDIQHLLHTVNNHHEELVVVETNNDGLDIVRFLENISKVDVRTVDKRAGYYYLTLQKVN
jgi:hypothetical protein